MTRSGGPLLSDGHGRIETAMLRKQDGLVTAGETSGSLDGPVKAIRDASPQARHHFTQADQVNLLVNASEADPDLGLHGTDAGAVLPAPQHVREGHSDPDSIGAAQAGALRGVTSRNGKIVRQELSEWLLVANNGPFPCIILLLSS